MAVSNSRPNCHVPASCCVKFRRTNRRLFNNCVLCIKINFYSFALHIHKAQPAQHGLVDRNGACRSQIGSISVYRLIVSDNCGKDVKWWSVVCFRLNHRTRLLSLMMAVSAKDDHRLSPRFAVSRASLCACIKWILGAVGRPVERVLRLFPAAFHD